MRLPPSPAPPSARSRAPHPLSPLPPEEKHVRKTLLWASAISGFIWYSRWCSTNLGSYLKSLEVQGPAEAPPHPSHPPWQKGEHIRRLGGTLEIWGPAHTAPQFQSLDPQGGGQRAARCPQTAALQSPGHPPSQPRILQGKCCRCRSLLRPPSSLTRPLWPSLGPDQYSCPSLRPWVLPSALGHLRVRGGVTGAHS